MPQRTAKEKTSFKFTFQDLDRDIDKYLNKYGTWDRSGPTPIVYGYDKAKKLVFDAYLEKKAYAAVVHYLLTSLNWNWGGNEFLYKAIEALRKDAEIVKLKRLWRGVIAVQRQHFWELHAHRDKLLQAQAQMLKVKGIALESMGLFRSILVEFDEIEEIVRLDEEIGALEREERRTVSSKPDPRLMDETLFWEIIEQAKQPSSMVAEQVEAVTEQLEAFKASQIKAFQRLLDQKMAASHRWDIWALAYMAQGGCSDDAFESFRAWLVLQGREVFELALTDIRQAMEHVPSGLGTSAQELLNAAFIAYEARAGKLMPPSKPRSAEPLGDHWEEDDLERVYPEIFKYYRELGM